MNQIYKLLYKETIKSIKNYDYKYHNKLFYIVRNVWKSDTSNFDIHNRLNELNIENEFYIGDGELHEYWGALNGNWFGGPNDNYTEIIQNTYNFLYEQLDSLSGDINEDGVLNILDVVQIINLLLTNIYDTLGDLNNDNVINILDVVLISNLILNIDE